MINTISQKRSRVGLRRNISLTFDDGPDPVYTPMILNVLKRCRVKATFFVVGKNVKKYPSILERIHREGHDIGNHTYSHPISPLLKNGSKNKFIRREIIKTNHVIKSIIGSRPLLFRPTLALWDWSIRDLIKEAEELGHIAVGWSCSGVDWFGSKFIIRQKLLKESRSSGDIVLLHDGSEKSFLKKRDATVAVLPEIIENYKKQDLEPLALTEIMENGDGSILSRK